MRYKHITLICASEVWRTKWLPLPTGSVQLGLNFSAATPELFTSAEMGEDVLQAINLYLKDYHALAPSIRAEIPNLRSALIFSRPFQRYI
jgi:hypothetical protein